MSTCLGRAAFAALIVFGAATSGAQITTVVAAPPKRAPSPQAVAQREQAAQDSIARVTLTGMKQWVDSAATALAIRPDTGAKPADTAAAVPAARPTTPEQAAPPRPSADSTLREGVRAPNTATPVPTISMVGVALILLGIAVQPRRRPARVRARR